MQLGKTSSSLNNIMSLEDKILICDNNLRFFLILYNSLPVRTYQKPAKHLGMSQRNIAWLPSLYLFAG